MPPLLGDERTVATLDMSPAAYNGTEPSNSSASSTVSGCQTSLLQINRFMKQVCLKNRYVYIQKWGEK